MGIVIGIFVVAFGAVLAFAVDWSIGGLDLTDVGWILMIAGVVGLILWSALWKRRLEAEDQTSTRHRRVPDAPRANDDPTPRPPTTKVAAVPPPAETVPPAPQQTVPTHAAALRKSAPSA